MRKKCKICNKLVDPLDLQNYKGHKVCLKCLFNHSSDIGEMALDMLLGCDVSENNNVAYSKYRNENKKFFYKREPEPVPRGSHKYVSVWEKVPGSSKCFKIKYKWVKKEESDV